MLVRRTSSLRCDLVSWAGGKKPVAPPPLPHPRSADVAISRQPEAQASPKKASACALFWGLGIRLFRFTTETIRTLITNNRPVFKLVFMIPSAPSFRSSGRVFRVQVGVQRYLTRSQVFVMYSGRTYKQQSLLLTQGTTHFFIVPCYG